MQPQWNLTRKLAGLLVCSLGFGFCAGAADANTNRAPPMSSTARGQSRSVYGYDPTADFLAFDPEYRQKHSRYARDLRELQLELARQAAKGRATPCSRQLFLEARWLVFCSAHWDKMERRLQDLRE